MALKRASTSRRVWQSSLDKESMLRQKAKQKWLAGGDSNSKFLHQAMKQRHKRNYLVALNSDDGWVDKVVSVKKEVKRHFEDRFKELVSLRPSLYGLPFQMLDDSDKGMLEAPFMIYDIKQGDLLRVVEEFHKSPRVPKAVNVSFIALIPKLDNPLSLDEFKPICLVGSVYKIFAKLLAERIKCMKALVFNSSMYVLVNGSPTEDFKVFRGLSQGDPFSPFLFLLVAEGFSGLLFQAVSLGEFQAFQMNEFTHVDLLQYADDTFFIGEGSWTNLWSIKAFLRDLSRCLVFWKESWVPIVSKIRRRLAGWHNRLLSIGGRVVLLNSILSNLPIFFFYFYEAPKMVLKEIIKIQRMFLWGGCEDVKKWFEDEVQMERGPKKELKVVGHGLKLTSRVPLALPQ
ncbi:uncharacterized protein LOC127123404 [Lathyrus oleraceus]|uniref:uncharacterized protein LOC127123404 n=1 Tax=Pisum sativum TaxID=3888 RepID=UPI0021CFE2AB|nr:uncharacterized protein LOC127123404 [Pisum sativum]